jgi:hypothetical protein
MARRRGSSPLQGTLDSSKALFRVPFRVAGPGCPMAIRATALFHRGASKYPRRSCLIGDLVSKTNCVRQPVSVSDVGLHKVIVLANRINLFWGFNWKAVPKFLDERWQEQTDILIGCVDSLLRRRGKRFNFVTRFA